MSSITRVLCFTKYSRLGASSRLRSYQYLPLLVNSGFDVSVSSLFDDKYLKNLYAGKRTSILHVLMCYLRRFFKLFSVLKYDVLWIEKELFPYFPSVFEFILRVFRVRFVVDYDDAIFHNYDTSESVLIRRLLGGKIKKVMRLSNAVIAGNPYIYNYAVSAKAKYVIYIPTVVDESRYRAIKSNSDRPLVIGWIGTPKTQKYVLDISNVLSDVCREYNAELLFVGASEEIAGAFPGIDVRVEKWSEAAEADLIAEMDIGIMPLVDGPWEMGKCAYKIIQYMASGLPVVASPVGVNIDIVHKYECGLLADGDEQWRDAFEKLLSNHSLRSEMGRNARASVESQFSLASQLPVISKILNRSAFD